MNTKESIGSQVVRAVADREGIEPHELEEPLFDAIDPDALNALFRTNSAEVVFEYAGYVVTVTNGGDVEIEERDDGGTS